MAYLRLTQRSLSWTLAVSIGVQVVLGGFVSDRLIGAVSPKPAATAAKLLDLYEREQRAAVVVELSKLSDFRAFVVEVTKEGPKWIASAADASGRARRRRVAALFALEIAHATIDIPSSWMAIRDLIEWACQLLRHDSPDEFEHTWLLAADALMQGSGDMTVDPGEHARHSQKRFPTDARFRLAEVLVRREARRLANAPGTPVRYLIYGASEPKLDASKVRLQETVAALQGLEADPDVGAEASLRLGILLFHVNDLTASREHLRVAGRTSTDPFITYLAHLVTGLGFEADGLFPQAAGEYEASIAILPAAGSAVTALASLRFAMDHRDEAAALIAGVLQVSPPAFDPWREYSFGSFRFWPIYVASLRDDLRR